MKDKITKLLLILKNFFVLLWTKIKDISIKVWEYIKKYSIIIFKFIKKYILIAYKFTSKYIIIAFKFIKKYTIIVYKFIKKYLIIAFRYVKKYLLIALKFLWKITKIVSKAIWRFARKHKVITVLILIFVLLALIIIIFINSALNSEGPLALGEIPVNNVVIDDEDKVVYLDEIGDSETLIAVVYPQNAYNKAITWSSSNEDILSIDSNGTIKLLRLRNPGEEDVRVYVETIDGGFKDSIKVIIPIYNDYEKMMSDYLDLYEVEFDYKKELLSSGLNLVMNDKVLIPSLIDELEINSSDYLFNWREKEGLGIIEFDHLNPGTGEVSFIPKTLGETIIVFECSKNGEIVISKEYSINVVVLDHISFTIEGLKETYKQGEIIDLSTIYGVFRRRNSFGELLEEKVKYTDITDAPILETNVKGAKEYLVSYLEYETKIKYNVNESFDFNLDLQGIKSHYIVGENILNIKVVLYIDGETFTYNISNVNSNIKNIDMTEPGEKELVIDMLVHQYSFYFTVVPDDNKVTIEGLKDKYPLNSKVSFDEVFVNIKYENDGYYNNIRTSLFKYYNESELENIFSTNELGVHNVTLNIDEHEVDYEYEVVNELVNVKGFEYLNALKSEYLLNETFEFSVKPIFDGYEYDFNINDCKFYSNNEEIRIDYMTSVSGEKEIKVVYGDYEEIIKFNVNHLLKVNYYIDEELKTTKDYVISTVKLEELIINSYEGYKPSTFKISSGSLYIKLDVDRILVNVFDDTTLCEIDLYYERETYKITYRIPGQKDKVDYYLYGDEIIEYVPAEKKGYIFTGWDVIIPEYMPSNNILVTGKYESDDNVIYYIKYYLEGKSISDYTEVFAVHKDIEAYFTVEDEGRLSIYIRADEVLYETTREYNGYTYSGYNINENVCEVYFELNTYTIKYIIDGEEVSYQYKYLSEIADYNPEKAGYTLEWETEIPEYMPANDLVIYGNYNPNSYKLTLVYNNKQDIYTYKCGEALRLPILKHSINEFLGWFDENDESHSVMASHDLVLYSKWKEYKHIVSYEVKGLNSFYLINSVIELDDVFLTFTLDDNSVETVCIKDLSYAGSFDTSSAGIKEIVIKYENQEIIIKFEVTSELKYIVDVEIENFPKYFYLNEKVSLGDYYLIITYTDSVVRLPLTDKSLSISGFDTDISGNKTINIGYLSETLSIPYKVINPIIITNTQVLTLNKSYSFIVNVDQTYLFDDYDLYIEKNSGYNVSWVKNKNGSFTVTVELIESNVDLNIGIKDLPCKSQMNFKLININDLKIEIVGNDYSILNKGTVLYVVAYYEGVGYKLNDVTYSWSNSNGSEINTSDNYAQFISNELGIKKVSVEVMFGGSIQVIEKEIDVIDPYVGISFVDDKHYGIGEVLTLGGFKFNSSNKKVSNEYLFNVIYKGGTLNASDIAWYTSDDSIASFGLNGELIISGTGYVTLYATSKEAYKYGIKDENYVGSFKVKCVYDAVNVSTYEQLKLAYSENNKVVLNNSIDIGNAVMKLTTDSNGNVVRTKLDNVKYVGPLVNSSVSKIPTTWECDYLININGLTIAPNINYCLEITNDLYGNGFTLDCYQITTAREIDSSVNVFNGPLNFVSLIDAAAVKGQDNIGFIIKDNVTVDNVILQNCDDGYLYQDNKFVYSKLEKVGTTVEVMGDNVSIINSRIKNGRNVIRAYGTSNPDDVIHVNLESCIISNGREFLIKIGANKSIDQNAEITYNGKKVLVKDLYTQYGLAAKDVKNIIDKNPTTKNEMFNSVSPYLTRSDGSAYMPRDDSNQYDSEFVNNYLKTYFTVKNCVLENTGFYAIGLESKFAGPVLGGYRYAPKGIDVGDYEGVYNISGTSYSALLTLEGDVRIYNWKKLDDINSSSLIEHLAYAKILQEMGYDFTFDIKKMLANVCVLDGYQDILRDVNGTNYGHAGIVFYGLGKNYHMINLENYAGKQFTSYVVDPGMLGDSLIAIMMPWVAGKEPFRFYMFDANSEFSYEYQVNEIATGNAYKWITPVK